MVKLYVDFTSQPNLLSVIIFEKFPEENDLILMLDDFTDDEMMIEDEMMIDDEMMINSFEIFNSVVSDLKIVLILHFSDQV